MNPLKFHSLYRERKSKNAAPLITARWALAAFLAFFSTTNLHAEERSLEKSMAARESCKSSHLLRDAKGTAFSIYMDERNGVLKQEFNPQIQCQLNAGEESLSHNARALNQTPNLLRLRSDFFSSPDTPLDADMNTIGACRFAYQEAKKIFDNLRETFEKFCSNYVDLNQKALNCGKGVAEKKCKEEWVALKKANQDFESSLRQKGLTSQDYLKALSQATQLAREAYEGDLRRLEPVMQKRAAVSSTSNLSFSDCPLDLGEIKPQNGNGNTRTCTDYLSMLRGNTVAAAFLKTQNTRLHFPAVAAGPLITEQLTAADRLDWLKKRIKSQIDNEITTAQNSAKEIERLIDQGEKSDSASEFNVTKLTEAGTAASPLVQQLSKDRSSGGTLSGSLSSASSPSPLATLAAAGAVGALAARSLGNSQKPSGSELPATGPAGQAAPPGKADIARMARSPIDKGDESRFAGDFNKKKIPSNVDDANKAVTPRDPATIPQSFGSDGSSRTIAGKKNAQEPKPAFPANGALDSAGGGTGEGMGTFRANLEPRPIPKPPVAKADNEVANLLGQMKNLFNLDEGGGGLGGGPMPMSAGSSHTSGGASETSAEEKILNSEENETAQSNQQTEELSSAEPLKQDSEVYANPYGRSDITLFARVKIRHHRCMERGLILYDLKESVE